MKIFSSNIHNKNPFLDIDRVCKICGSIREFYMSHTCSDNKYVTGRSSRMTNINTNYQYVELSDNSEYKVKNKPYTDNKFAMIEIKLYRTGLKNISEFFKVKTVKEIFELCSKFKIEHSVKYSEDFNCFDFIELQGWDSDGISAFIRSFLIVIYNNK
jgi:hypothetical protein